jgi:hypothetical protein
MSVFLGNVVGVDLLVVHVFHGVARHIFRGEAVLRLLLLMLRLLVFRRSPWRSSWAGRRSSETARTRVGVLRLTAFCWLFRCVDWEKGMSSGWGCRCYRGSRGRLWGCTFRSPSPRVLVADLDTLMVSGRSEIRVEDDIRVLISLQR